MAIIKLKGNSAHDKNIYYEFDTDTEPLGEGGMGKVYRGRQISELTGISRDVAIKFMFDGLPQSVIDRARREASIQVVSENLVEMMGFIETTSEGPNHTVRSHYHVVSELLSGVMLADLINGVTTTKDGRQITFAQNLYKMYKEDRANFALIIMKNIASGIMTLHDKGYIHRDIDPTNIMVTEDGKIKLIDFGIAKKLPNHNTTSGDKLTTQDRSLTMTGQFVGKPQYAAPELVVGDIDYQNETTDIYAMGILFYQLLVGKLPFTGPVTKVLDAQKSQKTPVKNIAGIKDVDDFRIVVSKATEKEQDKRYQSAAEFRVALDAIGTGLGTKRWMYYIGGGVLALILVIAGYLALSKIPSTGENNIQNELYNASTAKDAWGHLKNQHDANSIFLQSRIYFDGNLPDSIVIMKKNLEGVITPDNVMAHKLLEEAYRLAPSDDRILYNLGLDWYQGEERGVDRRDLDKAKDFFEKAMVSAKASNDAIMQNRIQVMLDKFAE